MPTPAELAAQLRALADEVAKLGDTTTPDPPTGAPATPPGLAVTLDQAKRPVLTWDAAGGGTEWDVTDKNNPAKPVQVTVTEPRTVRSAMKAGSKPRAYSVRARNTAGVSDWCAPVTVSYDGGTPPEEPDTPDPQTGRNPTDVLPVLKTWTVTTTTGQQGSPTNKYPVGDHASIPGVFYVTDDGGVMFHATVNGFTTPNSKRCRVEGRQMADANWTKAAWNGSDPHTLDAELWISTAGLQKRKRVCGLQIHDGGDDVLQVAYDAALGLIVLTDDGQTVTSLDASYRDRQRFTCRIETGGGKIRVTYNGTQTVELPGQGTSWYFKAGAYNQASMAEHGEPASAYGEVCIYRLTASGSLT
jgi:hypothetical protein